MIPPWHLSSSPHRGFLLFDRVRRREVHLSRDCSFAFAEALRDFLNSPSAEAAIHGGLYSPPLCEDCISSPPTICAACADRAARLRAEDAEAAFASALDIDVVCAEGNIFVLVDPSHL